MREIVHKPSTLEGSVKPSGDKSVSHRALMFNAISEGKASVENLSPGADVNSTIRCLRALGVKIERLASGKSGGVMGRVAVRGRGRDGLKEPANVLNAGNSGTTTRLLTGLLAAQPFVSVITGDGSLRSRPMGRVITPLTKMGAHIIGRDGGTKAPLAINGGSLHGIEYATPVASAQLKSAILLAGLFAEGETRVIEPAPSRDHTERMLKAMGAHIRVDGLRITVSPSKLTSVDVRVPGDISSAAFWLVAACCHPDAKIRIEGVGINPSRTGILDALREMGARITIENRREEGGEPVADLVAITSSLKGIKVGGDMIPRIIDEIPILAVAACFASGKTIVRDAQELRVKETDRVETTASELSKMGAKIEKLSDGMIITGTGALRGAACRSHGDHRLAMSLGIAGLLASGKTTVEDSEAAQVSYPEFWQDLRSLAKD